MDSTVGCSIHVERKGDKWGWSVFACGVDLAQAPSHIVVASGLEPGIQEASRAAERARVAWARVFDTDKDEETAPLTEEQKTTYLSGGGKRCPYCASSNIVEGAVFDAPADPVGCEMSCDDCDRAWSNIYCLHDVVDGAGG